MRDLIRPIDILVNDRGQPTTLFQRFIESILDIFLGVVRISNSTTNVNRVEFGTIYAVDTTSGALTADLPNLEGQEKSKWVTFKNTGVNNLTLTPLGVETIDGAATLVLAANEYATLVSNKTIWHRIGG